MKARSALRFGLEGLEGALLLAIVVGSWPLSRRWLRDWGSRRAERERRWPGDDLLAVRSHSHTRAITIAAPARPVWKRLVQFGLGKAGFYSYELLERVGGIPVTNIESVEPAWQRLAVGDEVLLHPKAGIRVSALEPERSLCFGKGTADGEDVADASFSLYLEPVGEDECRLIVRSCFGPPAERLLTQRVAAAVEEALDFVMEQRMLRTLRRLSEISVDHGHGEETGLS